MKNATLLSLDVPVTASGADFELYQCPCAMSRSTAYSSTSKSGSIDSPNVGVPSEIPHERHAFTMGESTSGTETKCAVLIGLDWGTSSLRASLFDASGEVIARRTSAAGIMNLPCPADAGGFEVAFEALCGAWLSQWPGLPVIAAGMVGSAQGWTQAPYAPVPANVESLVERIVQVRTMDGALVH